MCRLLFLFNTNDQKKKIMRFLKLSDIKNSYVSFFVSRINANYYVFSRLHNSSKDDLDDGYGFGWFDQGKKQWNLKNYEVLKRLSNSR